MALLVEHFDNFGSVNSILWSSPHWGTLLHQVPNRWKETDTGLLESPVAQSLLGKVWQSLVSAPELWFPFRAMTQRCKLETKWWSGEPGFTERRKKKAKANFIFLCTLCWLHLLRHVKGEETPSRDMSGLRPRGDPSEKSWGKVNSLRNWMFTPSAPRTPTF